MRVSTAFGIFILKKNWKYLKQLYEIFNYTLTTTSYSSAILINGLKFSTVIGCFHVRKRRSKRRKIPAFLQQTFRVDEAALRSARNRRKASSQKWRCGMFIDVQRVISYDDREMAAIHFAGTRENLQPGVEIFLVIQQIHILIPEWFQFKSKRHNIVLRKKYGRNTLYGKNPKYCKTLTFRYFHGGKKICSQNQSAEKILKYFFSNYFLIDLISSPQVASSRRCAPRRLLQRLVLGFA